MDKNKNSAQHGKDGDGEEVNWAVVGPILAVIAALIIAVFFF